MRNRSACLKAYLMPVYLISRFNFSGRPSYTFFAGCLYIGTTEISDESVVFWGGFMTKEKFGLNSLNPFNEFYLVSVIVSFLIQSG